MRLMQIKSHCKLHPACFFFRLRFALLAISATFSGSSYMVWMTTWRVTIASA